MPFTTFEEIAKSLAAAGFMSSDRDRLVAQARPTMWLRTRPDVLDGNIAIGATKIGGDPDLPKGAAWPMRLAYPDKETRKQEFALEALRIDKYTWMSRARQEVMRANAEAMAAIVARPFPLSFIAQINLADVCSAGLVDADLPKTGLISIFCMRSINRFCTAV